MELRGRANGGMNHSHQGKSPWYTPGKSVHGLPEVWGAARGAGETPVRVFQS